VPKVTNFFGRGLNIGTRAARRAYLAKD